MRLDGEIALITGSTAGIGKAIALRAASEGAAVAVTGRNVERGSGVVEAITDVGGRAVFIPADLAQPCEPARLVADVLDAFGGLTVLVNNAVDADDDAPVAEITDELWERVFAVNVTAPMRLCRAGIAPMLEAGHGAIVNISSRAEHHAIPGYTAYVASKGALAALTRAIAVDYAKHHIRANTISPGYVINERRDADITPARLERIEAMHLTRVGEPEDVASAVVYLASRESEWLTGENMHLDGGSSVARGRVRG